MSGAKEYQGIAYLEVRFRAKQMDRVFAVHHFGVLARGEAGDYLVEIDGKYWKIGRELFEQSYKLAGS